jgi:hypothetical protein
LGYVDNCISYKTTTQKPSVHYTEVMIKVGFDWQNSAAGEHDLRVFPVSPPLGLVSASGSRLVGYIFKRKHPRTMNNGHPTLSSFSGALRGDASGKSLVSIVDS